MFLSRVAGQVKAAEGGVEMLDAFVFVFPHARPDGPERDLMHWFVCEVADLLQ